MLKHRKHYPYTQEAVDFYRKKYLKQGQQIPEEIFERMVYQAFLLFGEYLEENCIPIPLVEDIDVFVVSRQYEFGVFSHINDDQLGVIIARLSLFVEYCQDNKDIILDGRLMGEPVARYLVINNEREVIYHDSVFMKIRDKFGPGIFKR